MSSRSRLAALTSFAVGAALLLGVGAAVLAQRQQASAGDYRGSTPPAGIALADFDLRSYTGERVSRESLRGKVVALTFLESNCKEACPVLASQIARGLQLLSPEEREEVAPIAISTHPHDDTPANVRSFLEKQRALGKLEYLIGTEQELRPVWKRFQILSALDSGDADTHSGPLRVYDADGEWVSTLHAGADLTAESFAHDVRRALAVD
jgi:protein SCO1/2